MATIARKTPVGANPATNGINSLDDSITLATNLKNAISSFASNDGFNLLSLLIDRIPQLEEDIKEKDNEIKKKDEQIKVLEVQATSDKESYTTNQQKALEVYSLAYDKWAQKRTTLQSQMESKEAILKEKDEAVMKLQTDLENFKTKRHELEAESKELITRLTKRDKDIAILKNQLQQARESLNGYSEKLTKSHSQVAELEDLKRKNKNESEKLKSDYSVLKDRMKEVTKLSVPLKDVNVDDMANELEELWASATALVRKFFGQDLTNEMLQNDWGNLRNVSIFKHNIPLPQSNSDIAKDMRVAAILGVLARLIDKYIFQPTYLLSEESGFRELLRREAKVDQRKERFVRGTLLSMFPNQQEANGDERIVCVIDDLLRDADLAALLTREAIMSFQDELDTFLEKAKDSWRSIQHSKQKLEPIFVYGPDTGGHWQNFELQVPATKEGKRPVSSVASDDLEDEPTVILPWIYLIGSEMKPITKGIVLQKAQFRVAAQELRDITSNTPFEEQPWTRQRSRPSRTMSMGGESTRGGPAKNHFLSKSGTPAYV